MDPIFTQPFNLPPPRPKGGMFGGDGKFGVGQAIVAALNGYLAGTGNPVGMQNMQMMAVMRQRQLERQQGIDDYSRKRTDDNADWQAHEQWKIDNPSPPNNDTVNDFNFINQQIGPEAAQQYLQSKTNPIVMTPYGPMPYSQVTGAQAPAKPVGNLTPINEGGPSPGGSGGFPGYR